MTLTIAVAGKGGTGKTTVAGLLIRSLVERGLKPVLAIDADPASNLNTVLGLPLERTVGDIREDTSEKARSGQLEAGVPKADLLDYEINASLVEYRRLIRVRGDRQRSRSRAPLAAHDTRRRCAAHRERRHRARSHDGRPRR
jgi:CO dehydrogenase nickel-insertion accessory protein CooC1